MTKANQLVWFLSCCSITIPDASSGWMTSGPEFGTKLRQKAWAPAYHQDNQLRRDRSGIGAGGDADQGGHECM
jgi:hypothetical protein